MIKPKRLKPGDRIAAVSLSWGGPGKFPHRYEAGKSQFEQEFGVRVVESEHALRDPEWLARNPKARADDLIAAFSDPTIDGIISTTGGDDSIRLLPYLDLNVIRGNPTVFMGFSDTTISHAACFKAGLVSFYGPTFMSGFAENTGMFTYMVESVRRTLFSDVPIGRLNPNRSGWTDEGLDWSDPGNQAVKRKLHPSASWKFHQEAGVMEGVLFGGCVEVLDWLRGTSFWPSLEQLDGAVLFLETSEEAPPPTMLSRFVRSLAAMGALERLGAILLGRPGGELDPAQFSKYDNALVDTVRVEYGLSGLAIVTNMDFGHTDPKLVIPLGLHACVDSTNRVLSINEPAVISNGQQSAS
ncbi:MAG: LD-carboxypeptidase [Opitutales bacterium]|nr:LD-carboxypeptidase [Opitutales bacterium]